MTMIKVVFRAQDPDEALYFTEEMISEILETKLITNVATINAFDGEYGLAERSGIVVECHISIVEQVRDAVVLGLGGWEFIGAF